MNQTRGSRKERVEQLLKRPLVLKNKIQGTEVRFYDMCTDLPPAEREMLIKALFEAAADCVVRSEGKNR